MGRFPLANKSFGQHFLNSPLVINKITSPLPETVEAIIEIGPGPAVLTPYLASYKIPLFVIEMDERFVELLIPVVGKERIFQQDALLFDWEEFFRKHPFKSIWLVSNLPYNVSVPLTVSFLKIPQITQMTLMYQKEVAQKILPSDSRNAMGSLHALTFSQFELKHVVYAPPGAFIPPPKVDSQVLSFKRRGNPDISLAEINQFEKFLRVIFSQRRKQLGGILKNEWGSDVAHHKLSTANLNPQLRAEALTYQDVLKLFRA
jgi:16S rRNA (adenine1518-N6/adenine1519-N6)-dimethyltransferase